MGDAFSSFVAQQLAQDAVRLGEVRIDLQRPSYSCSRRGQDVDQPFDTFASGIEIHRFGKTRPRWREAGIEFDRLTQKIESFGSDFRALRPQQSASMEING